MDGFKMFACNLDKDINECPFYNRKNSGCNNQDNCSFKELIERVKEEKYDRQPRWYEKYYKK